MTASAAAAAATPLCARLDGVSRLFGSFAALRQVSVDLEPGRCYVLIGENGAGKSTLLRILAGLLRPSFGTVKVFGSLDPHEARARIGYMSHAPMLYDELTAQENLRYFSSLYPGRPNLSPAEALRQVGLDTVDGSGFLFDWAASREVVLSDENAERALDLRQLGHRRRDDSFRVALVRNSFFRNCWPLSRRR